MEEQFNPEQMDEFLDETEDGLDQNEEIQDGQEASYEYGTVPSMKQQDSIYKWFWKVVQLGEIKQLDPETIKLIKVGNLHNTEVGETTISVRDALNLNHLGNIFGHPQFGAYFGSKAMITSATSMSRKGWFMDLSISQKKVRERARGESSSSGNKGWRMFSGKKKEEKE